MRVGELPEPAVGEPGIAVASRYSALSMAVRRSRDMGRRRQDNRTGRNEKFVKPCDWTNDTRRSLKK